MSRAVRRLAEPHPARVDADRDGSPQRVDGLAVDAVREQWLVEDRWWTGQPLRRRYAELVMADGRNLVVYCDLVERRWWRQRA